MEWRIARARVINYEGDVTVPPVQGTKKNLLKKSSGIRGGTKRTVDLDSSDDDYWDFGVCVWVGVCVGVCVCVSGEWNLFTIHQVCRPDDG